MYSRSREAISLIRGKVGICYTLVVHDGEWRGNLARFIAFEYVLVVGREQGNIIPR